MTEDERSLLVDLTTKRISRDAFLNRYPADPVADPTHIEELLRDAASSEQNLAEALFLGYAFGFTRACVPVLSELLQQDWHRQHEELAELLQNFRDPQSVTALLQAAIAGHPYLGDADARALARRCIWALGDIDTEESRSSLRTLLSIGDSHAKEVAAEQLELGGAEKRSLLPYRQHRDRRYRHPLDDI